MKWPSIVLPVAVVLALVPVACQGPRPSEPTPDDGDSVAAAFPLADDWAGIMKHVVGPRFDESIPDAFATIDPDLDQIALDARVAADHMALGYGIHARPALPEFAIYARETETWMREIARRAEAHDPQLEAWIEAGFEQYCDRCHDAVDNR